MGCIDHTQVALGRTVHLRSTEQNRPLAWPTAMRKAMPDAKDAAYDLGKAQHLNGRHWIFLGTCTINDVYIYIYMPMYMYIYIYIYYICLYMMYVYIYIDNL